MCIPADEMKKVTAILLFVFSGAIAAIAQDFNQITDEGTLSMATDRSRTKSGNDSLGKHKEIPRGLKVWTVDERFGDRIMIVPDTASYMFMNETFTSGIRDDYNTTGNLGAPRISRIFIDRQQPEQFMFTQPYDYFITPVSKFHFTNTLSPITNLTYHECGDKNNGEDHFKALFAVNAGKKIGVGFKFDYIYGRGYYQNQSTAHFNYSMYGSYDGDRYQASLLFSTNHQKVAENGGVTDDRYITHPELFQEDFRTNEIPTVLTKNWNRNDNQHVFFSHRYNIGFNRKVPMTEEEIKAKQFGMESNKENDAKKKKEKNGGKGQRKSSNDEGIEDEKVLSGRPDNAAIAGKEPMGKTKETSSNRIKVDGTAAADSLLAADTQKEKKTEWMKNEYVPVTSLIHTLKFDNYRRIYQSYATPEDYCLHTYIEKGELAGDSIFDQTKHYEIKNTFAISLLEGFNKWAKAGLKGFVTSDLRHFSMPDTLDYQSFNEHHLSVGGQLSKTAGALLHYNAIFETWLTGADAGQLKFDATADLNFKLLGDTVQLAARGYFYRLSPTFFQRKYHSKHLWWDNDGLEKETRMRLEGIFSYRKTRTVLRVAVDNIRNHTYFAQQYRMTDSYGRTGNTVSVKQYADNLRLLTLQLNQDFTLGPLNWESQVTYQKSSQNDVLPVPSLNIYSNLYLKFKVAKVLKVDLGADVRYFTKYYAPDYSPLLGQFTVQDNGEQNVETGNYPIVNVYANMHLKHTRFYLMMSHVNARAGKSTFVTPHYPINGMVLRFGVSWNFFN